jgi:hypothetical protein
LFFLVLLVVVVFYLNLFVGRFVRNVCLFEGKMGWGGSGPVIIGLSSEILGGMVVLLYVL